MASTDNHNKSKKASFDPNNPKPLTPELLRSSSGLHDLTDEQAEEIIDSLYSLARILLTVNPPGSE
ncbi:hypothetical protein [Chitinophaga tropicalis]|uniref:Uncharacterized protein n=1 Tax=Chitinophaga tropicalis TaxID=2683588 RepID=A0A7K1U5E8_9BACT|nr:hypothetical protein [Chitinophaga tropicalis]MVT09506.1 hypothetical protein [Chitinophaga tropicalis]